MGRKLCTTILQEEVRLSFLGLFGASDRNAGNRTAEYGDYYRDLEIYEANEDIRKEEYTRLKKERDAAIKKNESVLRRQEKDLIQQYESAVEMQDFDYETSRRAFEKSAERATNQIAFNQIAETAAYEEQHFKKRDDLLAVMFDENDTLLEHSYASTGLQVNRRNQLIQASFNQSRNLAKFAGDIGNLEIERNKARSESQIETQKAIIEGMKAAGAIRSRGNAGRSANKSALAVMAESGALRASIANGLMYAEQSVDLGIAQLKDMLILDQTMVLAAKDSANNEYKMNSGKLDATLASDKAKISNTRISIKKRDELVRKSIANARLQADMQAEAQIMLEPQRLPALPDPREFYAEYDNPETEDYLEMFMRPDIQPFPDYKAAPRLDFERDYHYSRGRENVAASNFGDALKIGGMAATAVSGIGMMGGLGMAAGGTFLGASAASWGTIGTGLTGLSSIYQPTNPR